jgi:hypothetical protein
MSVLLALDLIQEGDHLISGGEHVPAHVVDPGADLGHARAEPLSPAPPASPAGLAGKTINCCGDISISAGTGEQMADDVIAIMRARIAAARALAAIAPS